MKAGFNTFGAKAWGVRAAAAAFALMASAAAFAAPVAEPTAPHPWQLNMRQGVTQSSHMAWEAHMVERCAAAGATRSSESVLATL